MDYDSLTQLISNLRAQTAKDSISPENVGYLLQAVLDAVNDEDAGTAQQLADIGKALQILQKADSALQSSVSSLQNADRANDKAIAGLQSSVSSLQNADRQIKSSIAAAAGAVAVGSVKIAAGTGGIQGVFSQLGLIYEKFAGIGDDIYLFVRNPFNFPCTAEFELQSGDNSSVEIAPLREGCIVLSAPDYDASSWDFANLNIAFASQEVDGYMGVAVFLELDKQMVTPHIAVLGVTDDVTI